MKAATSRGLQPLQGCSGRQETVGTASLASFRAAALQAPQRRRHRLAGSLGTRMLLMSFPAISTRTGAHKCNSSWTDFLSILSPPVAKVESIPSPPAAKVAEGISMYVNLPRSIFTRAGQLAYALALDNGFAALKVAGVDGVVVPVIWGLVEGAGPQQYDFTVYRQLAEMLQARGLKMQVVLEFCTVEGLVGLPQWVLKLGESDPDIFFRDQYGNVLHDCLSLSVDHEPAIHGRTGLQVYQDLMDAFRREFIEDLGKLISEVTIGTGPHAELRYPSYPAGKWHFPGIGEFMCYDSRMSRRLKEAAEEAGAPKEWGGRGPGNCGHYCMQPHETPFFRDEGQWASKQGDFFLKWYSSQLLEHGDDMLGIARKVFGTQQVVIGMKIPVVHWWYHTKSHAAENTAGIYQTSERNGYRDLIALAARHQAFLQVQSLPGSGISVGSSFCSPPHSILCLGKTIHYLHISFNCLIMVSCAEMLNTDQHNDAKCGPQEILQLIKEEAEDLKVPVGLENCFMRFDDKALGQLTRATLDETFHITKSLTFFSMEDELFKGYQWGKFKGLVEAVRAVREESNDSTSAAEAEAPAEANSSPEPRWSWMPLHIVRPFLPA